MTSEQDAGQVQQPDCDHNTYRPNVRIDSYLGTNDDGEEEWERKCRICGKTAVFTYDY